MFKATALPSQLKEKMDYYLDMVRGNEAVQIIRRDSPITVLVTQEHYLNLLSRLALYEKDPNEKIVPAKSSKTVETAIKKKLKFMK